MNAFFIFSSRAKRLILLLCLAMSACWGGGCEDTIWRGQVATVNGKPITLDQVKALRDSTHFDWLLPSVPELDVMRKQYGDSLTSLIAVELVKQQLAKKKVSVTPEELLAEENSIRADYPPGGFDDILVSEAIDLETWRFLLHNHLSVQRFLNRILRPDVVITPEEVDAYLKAHPAEFIRPPWAYFLLVSDTDKGAVAACAKALDEGGDPVEVQERHYNTLIRTVRLDINRLDPSLGSIVAKLRPGDLSPVFSLNGEFHQILLLKLLPERSMEPREAYLYIEEILVARKIQDAYNRWIRGRIQKSTIKISGQLLQQPHNAKVPQKSSKN